MPSALSELVPSFAGKWETSYGVMELEEENGAVSGTYLFQGVRATVSGTRDGNQLDFRYEEPIASGIGQWTLSGDGQTFSGRWQEDGKEDWWPWKGQKLIEKKRDFSGLWDTTFGRMRVHWSGKKLIGTYAISGAHGTLEGRVSGGRWNFRYEEPNGISGEGWFALTDEGFSLDGEWKAVGSPRSSSWTGKRILPKAGVVWLMVIEARWEESLVEEEYAFGDMLEKFFDRVGNVEVRHRFFANEKAFLRWCREIAYIAEPVVVSLSSHGSTKGLDVAGTVISPETIAEALRWSGKLHLLHFSSCDIMGGDAGQIIRDRIPEERRFPISGYASAVDWAASAVLEFAYFDMILSRGYTPEKAADELLKLMPFAGDRKVRGTSTRPAKFRFQDP